MRIAALVIVLLLVPSLAWSTPVYKGNRGECRRMTKQINRYENVVLKMAKDRGNKLWEESINQQVDRMKNRRADRCPKYREERSMLIKAKQKADRAKKVMKAAAKAAAKYFSGGLY